MLTKQELKDRLRPVVKEAGSDSHKFQKLAMPIMQAHLGNNRLADEHFEVWNIAVVELLEELRDATIRRLHYH